jgi:hypothetical protein
MRHRRRTNVRLRHHIHHTFNVQETPSLPFTPYWVTTGHERCASSYLSCSENLGLLAVVLTPFIGGAHHRSTGAMIRFPKLPSIALIRVVWIFFIPSGHKLRS